MIDNRTERIRNLNDLARQTFMECRVVITPGIQGMCDIEAVLRKVQLFDQFNASNDPYGEHDFGSFRHADETVFWKIDYYDLDLTMHSQDESDPTVTARVLTIMLANEY
jgi:hypothetical protein